MFSAFVSYMPVQHCEGYNWSATGPKKSIINNQKAKTMKRMAEVWQQPPDEDGNAVTATGTSTATGMKTAMGTLTSMRMVMVTVTVTAMVTAMATRRATATATDGDGCGSSGGQGYGTMVARQCRH
jgi:hypothetical protein